MKIILPISLFFLLGSFCAKGQQGKELKNYVGHIEYDPSMDDPGFSVCNDTLLFQYYQTGLKYEGSYKAIKEHFYRSYKTPRKLFPQSGFITIRFVVNCKGEAGMFRIFQIDENYNNIDFPEEIVSQLLKLTKSLNSWISTSYVEIKLDSYYYLNFKISKGRLKEITP